MTHGTARPKARTLAVLLVAAAAGGCVPGTVGEPVSEVYTPLPSKALVMDMNDMTFTTRQDGSGGWLRTGLDLTRATVKSCSRASNQCTPVPMSRKDRRELTEAAEQGIEINEWFIENRPNIEIPGWASKDECERVPPLVMAAGTDEVRLGGVEGRCRWTRGVSTEHNGWLPTRMEMSVCMEGECVDMDLGGLMGSLTGAGSPTYSSRSKCEAAGQAMMQYMERYAMAQAAKEEQVSVATVEKAWRAKGFRAEAVFEGCEQLCTKHEIALAGAAHTAGVDPELLGFDDCGQR